MQMTTTVPRRRWVTALIIGAATLSFHGAGAAATGDDAAGFASPEAAAVAYAEAVAAGDLSAATDAFAIEAFVEHFDLAASTEYIGMYSVASGLPLLPNTDPFNVALNVERRRDVVTREILVQYFVFANPERDILTPSVVRPEAVTDLIAELDATMAPAAFADLAGATPIAIADLDAELTADLADENAVRAIERRQAVLGADELAPVALRANGFVVLFDAVRYGDTWWLYSVNGQTAAMAGLSYGDGGVLVVDADG